MSLHTEQSKRLGLAMLDYFTLVHVRTLTTSAAYKYVNDPGRNTPYMSKPWGNIHPKFPLNSSAIQ
jgi:hypothetical protein